MNRETKKKKNYANENALQTILSIYFACELVHSNLVKINKQKHLKKIILEKFAIFYFRARELIQKKCFP